MSNWILLGNPEGYVDMKTGEWNEEKLIELLTNKIDELPEIQF